MPFKCNLKKIMRKFKKKMMKSNCLINTEIANDFLSFHIVSEGKYPDKNQYFEKNLTY